MGFDVMAGFVCDFINPPAPSPVPSPAAAPMAVASVVPAVTEDVAAPPTPTPAALTPLTPRLLTTEARTPGAPLA